VLLLWIPVPSYAWLLFTTHFSLCGRQWLSVCTSLTPLYNKSCTIAWHREWAVTMYSQDIKFLKNDYCFIWSAVNQTYILVSHLLYDTSQVQRY
jgi:hypothetical protein